MKIRELFDQTRPIDRQITSVINFAGDSAEQLDYEIREYEVTDSLARHYERLMANLDQGFRSSGGHEIGVWVSGFYGSGKSSFTKYLGFALDPSRKIKGEPFLKRLQNQFPSLQLRQQLTTLAKNFPATVIMLDLASVASASAATQGVSRLLYWKVMEWAGYSKDEKLALLELLLEKDGKLEAFKKRFAEVAKGRTWESLKNDLLVGVAFAAKIVPEFYADIWPDAKSFNDTKVDARYGEDERIRQVLELIERRTKSKRVIFVIDEVGQFIEGLPQLILNMQGLAENLKNIGQGSAWLIATAQQTLPVTGPLFKLKDRFPDPLRVDIESSDIREITHRRLLRKSAAGEKKLQALFTQYEGSLTFATQLKNTKIFHGTLTADIFVRLYPFLPQHFNLLMELLRSLARSTGGIGLRSAIKIIQDVLVDVSAYRHGEPLLADAPAGSLATVDVFYDTLRRDIERANRQLVETVDRVGEHFGVKSLNMRVAKAVVVLQFIDGFPVSRHNVAALLLGNVAGEPLFDSVSNAVDEMLAEKGLPLTEIDGSLRFMSEAVSQIMSEKATLQPSTADASRILCDRLREILTPEPFALVESTLKVKAQLKLVQGSLPIAITHDKSEVEIYFELAAAKDLAEAIKGRTNDSRVDANRQIIYALGEDSSTIRDLVRDIYQCEEIHLRHRTEAAEKEVADFVRAQAQRADQLKRDLDGELQNAFLKGSFVFRGRPQAVATRGTEILNACKSELQHVAADVFNCYKQAAINAETSLAEKLLMTKDLANIPSAHDPLGLVHKQGNATQINASHPALVSILDHLKKHGEVDGRKLLDDFSRAPFGWFKDTTRHLVAALLLAGRIRLRIGAQWVKVPGEKALEALKSNVAFGKVDVATNEEVLPHEALLRAAQRLLNVTGETILPMPQNISRGVQDNFPRFQREHASLAAELTGAGLNGSERASRTLKQLSQILQGDASEAPAILGAEECELVDNLLWAREVRKAFDQKLHEVAGEARELLNEIPKLPAIGAASALVAGSATIRSQLAEFLDREDFYKVASDIRHRVQDLHLLVGNAAADLSKQFSAHLDQERNAIRNLAAWHTLPEGDRATFSHDLDELAYEEAKNLDGIRQLVNHRLEVDNQLGLIRQQVEARVKEIQLAASMTGAYALNETPGQPTATVVKVRRHYATASEVKPVVEKLQQAVNENRPVTFDLEP
jgi:hypothetical protein